MIASIHQPQYLPWLGFFDKIDKSDVFIFLDNTQFKKNEWQNRNKIRTHQGWQWLTVPVLHDFGQKINQVKINNSVTWRKRHWRALVTNYHRAKFFKDYEGFFEKVYARPWQKLAPLNIYLVEHVAEFLGIKVQFLKSSDFRIKAKATEHLLALCKEIGADVYLSGVDGAKYLDLGKFKKEGIEVVFQNYQHPVYPQLYREFISNMSVVDLLFNCGGMSLDIIRGRSKR